MLESGIQMEPIIQRPKEDWNPEYKGFESGIQYFCGFFYMGREEIAILLGTALLWKVRFVHCSILANNFIFNLADKLFLICCTGKTWKHSSLWPYHASRWTKCILESKKILEILVCPPQ